MHETHAEPRAYAYIHSCNLAITRTLLQYKLINLPIHDTSKRRWKIDLNQYMYYMFIQNRKLASILDYIFNQNCKLAATKRYIVIHFKWAVPFYNSLNQYIISSNRVANWPQRIHYICIQYHKLAKFVKGLNE